MMIIIILVVPACYLLVTVMLLKFALSLCVCVSVVCIHLAKCDLKKKKLHNFSQTTQLIALFVLYSILTTFGPCECANPFEKNLIQFLYV